MCYLGVFQLKMISYCGYFCYGHCDVSCRHFVEVRAFQGQQYWFVTICLFSQLVTNEVITRDIAARLSNLACDEDIKKFNLHVK